MSRDYTEITDEQLRAINKRAVEQPSYEQLREQNRVLRSNLVNCAARLEAYYGEDYPAVRDAKAALAATSQPGHEKDDRALVGKVDALEQALQFAVRGLKAAQPIVCSICCPSVKRTSEPWTHGQPCDSLTLTLRTVEAQLSQPAAESVQHLCGARGFGQSLDDRCPGCDATSQEGQG